MSMNPQAMENHYNERLNDIEHIISIESNGNDDLKQEGLIGAYKALNTDPHANNRFMLNKAKWSMVSFLRKGRSVDNGFYKRKNLKAIRYDHLLFEDGIFAAAVSNGDKDPVDEQAIFHIDLARFLEKLSQNERSFIRSKTIDGLSDVCIKRRLGITFETLRAMKTNIRKQIRLSFS
jgi:DNA-directed RNA polymerase specialized sigma24 family protein